MLTVIISSHNNDPTKDVIQETYGAPEKNGITLLAFYGVIFLTRQFIP
jgi:hypothetical protein